MSNFIPLDLGESGHLPPEGAIRAAMQACLGPVSYAPPGGLEQLRAAVAEYVGHSHGIPAAPHQITITHGASAGLFAAMSVLAAPGDAVLLPDPGYPAYQRLAGLLRLEVQPYRLSADDGWHPDFKAMERLLNKHTRLLVWNFPANPTGAVATRQVVDDLLAFTDRYDLSVLSDEVYADLILDGQHISPAALGGLGRVVCVGSFSKCFALSGWRVGYVIAKDPWAEAIQRTHWAVNMSPPTVGQIAALECMRAPAGYLQAVREQLRTARTIGVAALAALGVPFTEPAAGCFLWADVSALTDDVEAWAAELRRQQQLGVMPGGAFGLEGRGRIRILYSVAPAHLEEAFSRLTNFLGRPAEVVPGPAGKGGLS